MNHMKTKRQRLIEELSLFVRVRIRQGTKRNDWQLKACEILDGHKKLGRLYDELKIDDRGQQVSRRFWAALEKNIFEDSNL
jgi:hypothetical protein